MVKPPADALRRPSMRGGAEERFGQIRSVEFEFVDYSPTNKGF